MIYVLSDIHGMYEKYKQMLEKINFSPYDTLYILGDVIDRGHRSLDILKDMMTRDNIVPLIGNHELMAMKCLSFLTEEITDETIEQLTPQQLMDYANWMINGGDLTLEKFIQLSFLEREKLQQYLLNFKAYEYVTVGDRQYLLVHAGIDHFDVSKSLDEYDIDDLVWARPDFQRSYFADMDVIVGHTPTMMIHHKAEIFYHDHFIAIDCGACYPGGRLACLCLDTMEEFYV